VTCEPPRAFERDADFLPTAPAERGAIAMRFNHEVRDAAEYFDEIPEGTSRRDAA